VDLELSDEQTWLAESLEALLEREWPGPQAAARAGDDQRRRVWTRLVEFGALEVGDEGLGAVELCLVARALGAHLAAVPYLGGAALRYAVAPLADHLPDEFSRLGEERVAVALLEPGRGWAAEELSTTLDGTGLTGRKVAVDHGGSVDLLAVVAQVDGEPGLVFVSAGAPGVEITPQPALDATVPMAALELSGAAPEAVASGAPARAVLVRLRIAGGLLACAEAVGAAGRALEDARRYAGERRQFGRTIGSNQALRHLLADMYVRHASAWSTVLYAAAALDDDVDDPELTASVAKAYVARAAREVAHGAMQVFGGIAFTEEHPAHRFLRRIVVREQQFGDAAHHERELGRRLAARALAPAASPTPVS
jgi:alkylation response protein AidB-like acyl-CoA dehydrogenase